MVLLFNVFVVVLFVRIYGIYLVFWGLVCCMFGIFCDGFVHAVLIFGASGALVFIFCCDLFVLFCLVFLMLVVVVVCLVQVLFVSGVVESVFQTK